MKRCPSISTNRRPPRRFAPGARPGAPGQSHRPRSAWGGSRRHCLPSPPRKSVPAPAWRRSEPPDPVSSGCRAGVVRLPAWGSSPAARLVADTSPKRDPRANPPAMLPRPPPRSDRTSPRPPPARPRCREPVRRRGAECLPGRPCRRECRSGKRAPPSPYNTAFSASSGCFQAFLAACRTALILADDRVDCRGLDVGGSPIELFGGFD